MHTTEITYITPRTCKYILEGENIAGFRRERLHRIAKGLDIDEPDISKNDLLKSIVSMLDGFQANNEIFEYLVPKEIVDDLSQTDNSSLIPKFLKP